MIISNKSKILFVGDFHPVIDEGMKKISNNYKNYFIKEHTLLCLSTYEFGRFLKYKKIRRFDPDIIHYLTGPTIRSVILLFIYKYILKGKVKTISSGVRPYFSRTERSLLRFIRPDYFFSQSKLWEGLFTSAGSKCIPVPNGVDCDYFIPSETSKSNLLRKQFKIIGEKQIILHVGHIKDNRNLEIFLDKNINAKYSIVIIGSQSFSNNDLLKKRLLDSGVTVINSFIENINEIYSMADYYVFPVRAPITYPKNYNEVGVIDFPLSILEAMAMNIPVITTKLDALSRFLKIKGIQAFNYFDGTADDLMKKLSSCNTTKISTRNIALDFNSNTVFNEINNIYKNILACK